MIKKEVRSINETNGVRTEETTITYTNETPYYLAVGNYEEVLVWGEEKTVEKFIEGLPMLENTKWCVVHLVAPKATISGTLVRYTYPENQADENLLDELFQQN